MSNQFENWPPPTLPQMPPAKQAHLGWRLLGRILDVVNLLGFFVGFLLAIALFVAWWAPDWVGAVVNVLFFVGIIYLRVRWEATGGSPLRRQVGLHIVDFNTHMPIGYGRAIGRILVANISSIFMLGYLWMLWDPKKQTWHDKATNSTVILVRR